MWEHGQLSGQHKGDEKKEDPDSSKATTSTSLSAFRYFASTECPWSVLWFPTRQFFSFWLKQSSFLLSPPLCLFLKHSFAACRALTRHASLAAVTRAHQWPTQSQSIHSPPPPFLSSRHYAAVRDGRASGRTRFGVTWPCTTCPASARIHLPSPHLYLHIIHSNVSANEHMLCILMTCCFSSAINRAHTKGPIRGMHSVLQSPIGRFSC